jgi:hypothetical protein
MEDPSGKSKENHSNRSDNMSYSSNGNPVVSIHRELLKRLLLLRPVAVKSASSTTNSSGSIVTNNDRNFKRQKIPSSYHQSGNDIHNNHDTIEEEEEKTLQETLNQLRIKKAMLISNLSIELSKATIKTTTIAENLSSSLKSTSENPNNMYYLPPFNFSTTAAASKDGDTEAVTGATIKARNDSINNTHFPQLLHKISELRRQRRLMGAHRLTGISTSFIPNTNPHTSACIAAQFDLCSPEGMFIPHNNNNNNSTTSYKLSKNNRQAPVVFLDLICATTTTTNTTYPLQKPNNNSLGSKGSNNDSNTTNIITTKKNSTCSVTSKRLLLRLAQHTLPKAISVSDVLRRCFNSGENTEKTTDGIVRRRTQYHELLSNILVSTDDQGSITMDLGPYDDGDNDDDTTRTGKVFMNCMRVCLGAIYDALHAYVQRVSLCQWMLEQQKLSNINNTSNATTPMSLQDVLFSNTYDRISFSVALYCINPYHTKKIQRTLKVQLTYEGATPEKISLGWADTLDHLDVHWFLSDAATLMRHYPIPQVLSMLEEAAQQELR